MNAEVIAKFINKLVSSEETEIVSFSNLQFQYFKRDEDFILFFSKLSSTNLFYSALIYKNYQNQYGFKNREIEEIITNEILNQSEQLQGPKIKLMPELVSSEKLRKKQVVEINQIAELCIADILICADESRNDVVFQKNIKRIRRKDYDYAVFFNRCSELLFLFDNQNRCSLTIDLIKRIIEYCNFDDNLILIRVIKSLSVRPLYFYGVVTEDTTAFIRYIFKLNNPFVLRQLLELFPQIDFNLLSSDLNSFLQLLENCNSTKDFESNLIQHIICAEVLEARSNRDVNWCAIKETIYNFIRRYFVSNQSLRAIVDAFYICKSVRDDPRHFDNYLSETIKAGDICSNALSDIEQEAFLAIVRENPQKAYDYLSRLNNLNVYRLNNFVRVPEMYNVAFYKSQLCRLSSYYDVKTLAFIYFNSHLRVFLPIEELFRVIYENSSTKRDDYMMVNQSFGDFLIDGDVTRDISGNITISTSQFCTKYPALQIAGFDEVKKELSEKSFRFKLYVNAYVVKNGCFRPQMKVFVPGDKKHLTKGKNEEIDFFVDNLKQIEKKRAYNDTDISTLSYMPRKFSRYADAKRIGMQIIKCCNSFNDNEKAVEFLNSFRFIPYKMSRISYLSLLDYPDENKNIDYCCHFAETVSSGNGSLYDKLYIYFNTILRCSYDFATFLFNSYSGSESVDLLPFCVEHRYFFGGQIIAVTNTVITIRPYSFELSKNWSIVFINTLRYHEFSKGDYVSFNISKVNKAKNIIYALNLRKSSIRDQHFCDGMFKASLTVELNERDIMNLEKQPSGLDYKTLSKLAINEVKAIKLRLSDGELLTTFLSTISNANPWAFSPNRIPYIWKKINSNIKYQIDSTINDLVDKYTLELAIRVFLNTSLKSYCSLDDFFAILINKHYDIDLITANLSPYVIVVTSDYSGIKKRTNVYINSQHLGNMNDGKYVVGGYDKTCQLIVFETYNSDL